MASGSETRELMYAYSAEAKFEGKEFQPCRHMTSLCPNKCNHATDLYRFTIQKLDVTANPDSTNKKWVTPVEVGTSYLVAQTWLNGYENAAEALQPGNMVQLAWNHEYVTASGCSSPQYQVQGLKPL